MNLKLYQIDAFTDKVFGGNPAAVCPLQQWLPDGLMQKIAMENNLAETAFIVQEKDRYAIRWFTPTLEVDLCGHATLASAYVLFHYEGHTGDEILFHSPRSGPLKAIRKGALITLDFPVDVYEPVTLTPQLTEGLSILPREAFKGKTDFMLVFDSEEQVRNVRPDFQKIATLPGRGVIVTAKGDTVDFVSRFFAPQAGVNEDPVTGSAHTTLTPYWAGKLGKTTLTARQLSARQGDLQCRLAGHRVEIGGFAKPYLIGQIDVEEKEFIHG
ncbi:MAG TPA: PhzF family phenazine biosynthesis protein [Chryseolinea sp.]